MHAATARGGKALAYCRSGNRSIVSLEALGQLQAGTLDAPESTVIDICKSAGYESGGRPASS